MKSIILTITLIFISLPSFSQNVEGTYTNSWLSNSGDGIKYTLILQDDGRFTFHHRRIYSNIEEDAKTDVEGTWQLDGHILILNTEMPNSESNKIATDLDANKAKFISVSPRHPKFNIIKPSLKFYESDIFYAKDMELVKTEAGITSSE